MVVKVSGECQMEVMEKGEVMEKVGGWFTVEVVLKMSGEFKAEVAQ